MDIHKLLSFKKQTTIFNKYKEIILKKPNYFHDITNHDDKITLYCIINNLLTYDDYQIIFDNDSSFFYKILQYDYLNENFVKFLCKNNLTDFLYLLEENFEKNVFFNKSFILNFLLENTPKNFIFKTDFFKSLKNYFENKIEYNDIVSYKLEFINICYYFCNKGYRYNDYEKRDYFFNILIHYYHENNNFHTFFNTEKNNLLFNFLNKMNLDNVNLLFNIDISNKKKFLDKIKSDNHLIYYLYKELLDNKDFINNIHLYLFDKIILTHIHILKYNSLICQNIGPMVDNIFNHYNFDKKKKLKFTIDVFDLYCHLFNKSLNSLIKKNLFDEQHVILFKVLDNLLSNKNFNFNIFLFQNYSFKYNEHIVFINDILNYYKENDNKNYIYLIDKINKVFINNMDYKEKDFLNLSYNNTALIANLLNNHKINFYNEYSIDFLLNLKDIHLFKSIIDSNKNNDFNLFFLESLILHKTKDSETKNIKISIIEHSFLNDELCCNTVKNKKIKL